MAETTPIDGRRRTWIKSDVFFYSGDIGRGLRDNFGLEGLVCFDAFLRACKVSQIEGQIRYASDEQFLVIVGLGPLTWTSDVGVAWTLTELWRWLGKRHMTSTRRHNGLTVVQSRRWDEWQTRRSDGRNTTPKRQECDSDADAEKEKESERETEITENPPTPLADFEVFAANPQPSLPSARLVEVGSELYEVLCKDPDDCTLAELRLQEQYA